MRKFAFIAAFALMGSPVIAQSIGEKSGVNSVLGIAPTTPDFVKEAAISDMFEIETSKLAAERGDEPTKSFANQMIAAHTKTSAELKAAVSSDPNTPLPTALDDSHQKKLDRLKSLQGADFLKEYHSLQVSAHKDAASLLQRYAKGGDSDTLKTWASKTLPDVQQHLSMAQNLDKSA